MFQKTRMESTFIPVFFGGDQLTKERAGGALDARLQASDPLSRLDGVIPKVEDWHALVCFYQVNKGNKIGKFCIPFLLL